MFRWFFERSQHENEESLGKKNLVYQQNKETWVQRQGREMSLMKQKNIRHWVLWNIKTKNIESYMDVESYKNIKTKDVEYYENTQTKDVESYET